MIKPTEKQLKYISNLQRYRRDVPKFTGETIQEASEFIGKYKDYPFIRHEEDIYSQDELMMYFDEHF